MLLAPHHQCAIAEVFVFGLEFQMSKGTDGILYRAMELGGSKSYAHFPGHRQANS
jgi:hypothetical protein